MCARCVRSMALYSTADLTCRPKYRTSVVLPFRVYFVLRKYERVSQLQRVRPSSTPSSLHGWERCPVRHIRPPLAPPRDDTALGRQSRPTYQTGRPAKHDVRIETTALAVVSIRTRYCIEYKILVIVLRALRDRTPTYITSLITPYVPRRALRSADRALLVVPRHNLEHLSDAAHSPCRTNSVERTT